MASVMIVFNLPITRQFSNLLQIPERVHVQNILTETAIKTLDKTVLLRLARLNAAMTNPVAAAKFPEKSADKLWTVVTANVSWKTAFRADNFKAANNP
jgi:hypothetical protein